MNHITDRAIDEVGKIVLPFEVRELLGVKVGEKVSIYVKDGEVILKRA